MERESVLAWELGNLSRLNRILWDSEVGDEFSQFHRRLEQVRAQLMVSARKLELGRQEVEEIIQKHYLELHSQGGRPDRELWHMLKSFLKHLYYYYQRISRVSEDYPAERSEPPLNIPVVWGKVLQTLSFKPLRIPWRRQPHCEAVLGMRSRIATTRPGGRPQGNGPAFRATCGQGFVRMFNAPTLQTAS